jgi:hypothetical protein
MTWTRITDPDDAISLFPPWFGLRMVGLRGTFGLLLASGDIMRITSIVAVHRSSSGGVLLDVLLDQAGVPEGVDLAWRAKHYLGVPIPAAALATVNLAHVIAAVEFVAAEIAEPASELNVPIGDEVVVELDQTGLTSDAIARVTE